MALSPFGFGTPAAAQSAQSAELARRRATPTRAPGAGPIVPAGSAVTGGVTAPPTSIVDDFGKSHPASGAGSSLLSFALPKGGGAWNADPNAIQGNTDDTFGGPSMATGPAQATSTSSAPAGTVSAQGGWRAPGSSEIDPYKSKWTPGGWQGMTAGASESEGTGGDPRDVNTGLPVNNEAYWRGVGFDGPTTTTAANPEYQGDQGISPELQAWADSKGYRTGSTEGYGGLLDAQGNVVPGSAFGNRTNDDAGFMMGMLGLGGAGLAANAAGLGVNAAGTATGGAFGSGAASAGLASPTAAEASAWEQMLASGTPTETLATGAAGGAETAGLTGVDAAMADVAASGAPSVSAATPGFWDSVGGKLASGAASFGDKFGSALGNIGAAGLAGALVNQLGPKPPATPDFAAAAAQQGKDNLNAAQIQTQMNRVDTTTPFGFQKFGVVDDPSVPGGKRYTSTIGLSPEQQALYEAETRNQQGLQDIAGQVQGRVGSALSNPFSLDSVGKAEKLLSDPNAFAANRDQVTQALQERLTRQLAPQMERDRAALDNKLKNQGLMPGTEAYDNAMRTMLEAQGGQMQDIASRAIEMGGAEQSRMMDQTRLNTGFNNQTRGQSIQELLLERQQPLSEFNSLRTGNAPTLPTFQPFGMGAVAPAPTMQGVTAQYGANADSYNARLANWQNLLNFGVKVGGPTGP